LTGKKRFRTNHPKRDRVIVRHSARVWSGLSGLLGYFTFQCLSRFRRFHRDFCPRITETTSLFCCFVAGSNTVLRMYQYHFFPRKRPNPFDTTYPFIPQFLRGNKRACTHFTRAYDGFD
jgi:hypothetical protein